MPTSRLPTSFMELFLLPDIKGVFSERKKFETLLNSDVRRQSRIPSTGVQGNGSRLEDPRKIATMNRQPSKPMMGQPGVIARLMGIDAIPMPVKAADETTTLKSPPTSTSTEIKAQAKCSRTGDSRNKMRVLGTSRSRLPHPQEHLLQKIKEDFQSWQATTVAALGNNSKCLDGRCIQIIAQENLRKEKMARYGYGNNKQNECSMKNVGDLGNATEVGVDVEKKTIRPSQIVLLKPSSDIDADDGELLFGLSKVKRDDNMDKFLQEVKERLQKVKCTSDLRAITWGTEPNNVAQDIATQTIDLGKRLSRSKAFRSDRKRNHAITGAKHASPEHVKINTRNIPRTETVSPKKDDEESVDSFPIRSRGRLRSLTGTGFDEQTCTSSECLIDSNVGKPESKLVRSFSAPESRIRLFFDQSSNHGASDIASESGATTSSFSFRETVSNLRQRFSFRGKLFGRKKKPSFQELYPQFMSPSPSESFRLYNFPQASFAELPPSPVSPLEIVGHSSRNFFSDLNCSLAELSRNCPWEFEAPASELSFRTDITVETACIQDKAYLRQVLVAAGLYDNKANGRVARPICDYIFDEVEDLYHYPDRSGGDLCNSSATDHRMLFDLANEALQILVQGAKTGSSLGQWVIDSTGVSRGRKLVDDVWQQVQALRYPQMQTIDSMVAFEVRKSVWADVLLYEDVYVVGRMIERAIFDELVQDLLLEVFNCEQMA